MFSTNKSGTITQHNARTSVYVIMGHVPAAVSTRFEPPALSATWKKKRKDHQKYKVSTNLAIFQHLIPLVNAEAYGLAISGGLAGDIVDQEHMTIMISTSKKCRVSKIGHDMQDGRQYGIWHV